MRVRCVKWKILAVLLMSAGCTGRPVDSVETPPEKLVVETSRSPFADLMSRSGTSAPSRSAVSVDMEHLPRFVDVAQESGVQFQYDNGARGESIMVEASGGGCGVMDYDGDHRWDFYFCQGGDSTRPNAEKQPIDRLFHNRGDGQFVDVTEWIGIRETVYGQGVAIGDFDDDGFDDIYVTNVGRNVLYRNQGDGTFVEVTDEASVGDRRWSTSAAWADIDLDGDLDLYVCNYLQYDPLHPIDCRNPRGQPSICHPRTIDHWPDECFMNQGDGTFTAEAQQRGLYGEGNKGLGVAVADYNDDGLPDIYVANDTTPNFLFVNQGKATYRDMADLWGCAVNRAGSSQASMGIAVADYDNNGYLDIYVTHFYGESNTLYANLGTTRGFRDVTGTEGLHEPTLFYLGFGTIMADFNLDGRMDVFVANGDVENKTGNPTYKMKPQLLTHAGGRWVECGLQAGAYFSQKLVGRGVASCDYDDDNDLDLVVVQHTSPAALLRNESRDGHWLKMRFIGSGSNRRGIGVRVTLQAGETSYLQELCGGTSYVSTNEPMLLFGLGQWEKPVSVHIRWPSGITQTMQAVDVDQSLVVEEPRTPPPVGSL